MIGTVTDTGRLVMRWHGEQIVDVPPRTLAHEGPVYQRPIRRPYDQDALNGEHGNGLPRPQDRRAVARDRAEADVARRTWPTSPG